MVNLSGEMASTERLIEYGKLPPEGEFKTEQSIKEKLPENWPSTNTSIEVKHLNFRYRPDLPLVLKDVNFKFEPKEHIGVVGRTGAGKSSLTVCFYRLAKLDPGSEIIVDG